MEFMFSVLAFVLGGVIGSFLNVCIFRMPQDASIVWPGSHCPRCDHPIRWHDNIPLLSYLILGGRCRDCKQPIAARYFFVELISAVLWLVFFRVYGFSLDFMIAAFFMSAMIVVTVTDLETGLIPDLITIPGMIMGLCLSIVNVRAFPEGAWYHKLLVSAGGLLTGGGTLLLVAWLGKLMFKKDSMGGGDIKLLAMVGTFLGPLQTVMVFFFSPFFALPFALFYRFIKRQETIVYGPFLVLSSALFFFWGEHIIEVVKTLYGV